MEKATYVSIWDDGIVIQSSCLFDKKTGTVSEIEKVDVDSVDILNDEYIELSDGTKITTFYNADDDIHISVGEG